MSQNLINTSEKHEHITCRNLSAQDFTLQVRCQKGSYLYEYLVSLCRNWEASLDYEYSKSGPKPEAALSLLLKFPAHTSFLQQRNSGSGASRLSEGPIPSVCTRQFFIRHISSALGLEPNRGSVFWQNLYSRNNSSFQGLGALLCHHQPSVSAVALAVLTAAWDLRARLDSALTRNPPWISRGGVEFIRSVTVSVWDKKFLEEVKCFNGFLMQPRWAEKVKLLWNLLCTCCNKQGCEKLWERHRRQKCRWGRKAEVGEKWSERWHCVHTVGIAQLRAQHSTLLPLPSLVGLSSFPCRWEKQGWEGSRPTF